MAVVLPVLDADIFARVSKDTVLPVLFLTALAPVAARRSGVQLVFRGLRSFSHVSSVSGMPLFHAGRPLALAEIFAHVSGERFNPV